MAQTRFMETEALLAVMQEDEEEAQRILSEMLPNERRTFMAQLDRLSLLADDTQYCPRCRKLVDLLRSVSRAFEPRVNWHRECLDAQRAEEGG